MQWQVPSRDRVKVKLRKPKLRALSRVQAPPEALGVALAILFFSLFFLHYQKPYYKKPYKLQVSQIPFLSYPILSPLKVSSMHRSAQSGQAELR